MNKSLSFHVWIVCALGLFIDGYDLYISSVAEPFINAMYHPSALVIGLTQAAAPIGAALGAIIIGRLADSIGRKSLLIFNFVFFVAIALLTALAWNNISLCFFRFLIGFGVGADYPICAAYLAEMLPKDNRSKLIATAMFINCLASPVGVLVAWVIFKLYPYMDVWRLMFASGAIPAIIGLLFRMHLPESFLWQVQKNLKQNKAILWNENYKKLFSPPLIKMTLCFGLCWFFQDMAYYGIVLFTPHFLQALGIIHSPDLINSGNDMLKSTLLINFFVAFGAFTVIFFIERMNHCKIQKIGFIYSFVGLLILGFSQSLVLIFSSVTIFVGFILFNFFINFGPGITTYLLPAELYETELKATGHGLASGCGKLGAFAGAIFLPLIQLYLGIYLTLILLSFALLIGWWLTHLLSKEELSVYTSLETIPQESLVLSTKT